MEQQISENLSSTTSRSETQFSEPPIPNDLIVEVFSRVPGKSIARFRCVSKYLASILRRHDFTELFLTKSLTRPRLLFTVKAKGKLLLYSTPQPHNPDDNSCLVATPYHTSFPEYFPSDMCSTVCGLVLLQEYWKIKVRVICNPVTGQFLTLPKVLLKEKNLPKVEAKRNRAEIEGMYLGYDPIGKQFKVLCMTSSRDERPNTHQVLTL
ncbi:putative F-box protein At1g53360, partial [Raphanus sativus]